MPISIHEMTEENWTAFESAVKSIQANLNALLIARINKDAGRDDIEKQIKTPDSWQQLLITRDALRASAAYRQEQADLYQRLLVETRQLLEQVNQLAPLEIDVLINEWYVGWRNHLYIRRQSDDRSINLDQYLNGDTQI